jgi:primosomal protein N' (replication factor Y) (superfamily II helicase)
LTQETLWRVAVEAPLREPLTYAYSENLERGRWVHVPLGKRSSMGLVLGLAQAPESTTFTIKSIKNSDDELPLLHDSFVRWLEWLSEYYVYPLGLVAESSRPPLKRVEKLRKSKRALVIPQLEKDIPPVLTDEQAEIVESISKENKFKTHLIHGVTGSGKTEIYLRLIEKTIAEGKSVLVLVPEISLTPQLIHRFARRFGDKIAALHSQLTDREKTTQWWDVVEGRRPILIGARSALFCPQKNLGLVIVDEEQETSYKQDEKLKYHARDAAVMLGYFHNCPVLLGSATPSLESWLNGKTGKYQLHQLKKRVHTSHLPSVQIVDLKLAKEQHQSAQGQNSPIPTWMSPILYEKIQKTLEEGYQSALFLNRRGMAHVVMCNSCGYSSECPNCDIHLTLHGKSHLVCHYCDYHENFKSTCPSCKVGELTAIGLGTEKLEADLKKLFPDKKILRADRDEIQNREDLESFVAEMEAGQVDILVGTQMIAKGLDFPRLKLVGLVLADIGFNLPDFRCTERNFQLMVQMAGRPGRSLELKDAKGEVIIQTFNPENESLAFAINHDYEGFAAQELIHRQALLYPPHGNLISLRIQSSDHSKAFQLAQHVGNRARALQNQFAPYKSLEVLGPAEAPMAKLNNQYRYYLLLKGTQKPVLSKFIRQLLGDESWVPSKCRIIVDIDPLQLL